MPEHVGIHLREITASAADGVPVVAAEQHGEYLIAYTDEHVAIDEPRHGHRDGNQRQQRRVYSPKPFEIILAPADAPAGIDTS